MSQAAPTLHSERLILRPPTIDDFADCAALWADPEVTRYIGGRPFSAEESWNRLLRYAGHWQWLGYGYWMVIDRDSGRYIGNVGFADFKRDLQPAVAPAPEMGWVMSPWAHGRGLGSEAVRTALAWADARWPGGRTLCIIDPNNRASIRVADKSGYRQVVVAEYCGHQTLLFERYGAV